MTQTSSSSDRIRLIVATRNAHKAQEIAALLPARYEVLTLADFPQAPEIEENGTSFAENARLKSCGISALLPGLVLADDSGLCVDALGGAPGVHSARFAGVHGDDAANNRKLLAEGGRELAAFDGRVEGHITLTPSGKGGFGYDPLFVPEGHDETFADMPAEAKNRISHRSRALRQLLDYLR